MASIEPIDYSSRDFVSLVADLRSAASVILPEWTNKSDYDFGMVLLDLYAYVGDIMSYYIDRVANEVFLPTATRRQSVLNIANMLNYTPTSMAAAQVSLEFTLTAGTGSTTIPAGTQVATLHTGSTNIIFETDDDLVIDGNSIATPDYTGSVTATQGTTITDEILTSNASGAPNQVYTLFQSPVIEGSIVIETVDANNVKSLWHSVSSLLNTLVGERAYSVSINDNDVVFINFGDNAHGFAPTLGSRILATYRLGAGAAGNVAAKTLVEMVNPMVQVAKVTNLMPAVGGVDAESIDSMRNAIPQSLFALNRAVTLKDYAALSLQVPGVAKAAATAVVYTSVMVYIAPVGGGVAPGAITDPASLKYNVLAYLNDRKMINVTVQIADPVYVPVDLFITVYVLGEFFQKSVQNEVTQSIQNLLKFDNVDFAKSITQSAVYHAVQSGSGVDYCVLTKLDRSPGTGLHDVTMGTNEIPKLGTLTLVMVGGVV